MPASFDDDSTKPAPAPAIPEVRRRRRRLILYAIGAGILIAVLGLGLGLGLTLRSSSSPPYPAHPTPTAVWQPTPGTTWQIVLNAGLDIPDDAPAVTPDVAVYDIDLFLHADTSVIANLHKLGKKVICYFSAGSYEPDRPDSDRFRAQDLGDELAGWPGERWLNISSPSVAAIMAARVALASRAGCDGIDPDNVDGYQNGNGLDLTSLETIAFVEFLVKEARRYNLAVGLKNALDVVPDVVGLVQFAVNEQCAEYRNCGALKPFVDAGKAVFHVEYPEGAGDKVEGKAKDAACKARGAGRFSTVIKALNLGGWVEFCDGTMEGTKVLS